MGRRKIGRESTATELITILEKLKEEGILIEKHNLDGEYKIGQKIAAARTAYRGTRSK